MANERVRSPALSFDISPFHFFELFSKLLQSKPIQAANFEQVFDFELKLGHEFEPQFELELKSKKNLSSSYCFCSRSAHARRRLWEPSDMGIVGRFSSGVVPFFEAIFGMVFFSKMLPNGAPNGLKKLKKSDKKRT